MADDPDYPEPDPASPKDFGGCLQLSQFNAVVVGNGAVGSAVVKNLLQRTGVGHIAVLGRTPKGISDDERTSFHAVDAQQPESVDEAALALRQQVDRVHLLINTVGMLHTDTLKPEKRLRDVTAQQLQASFAINAVFPALLAQAFSALMRHKEPAVFASLSARVGSIEDNRLGGWYSYRATKAAQNMLLRTLSREWGVSHRNVSVVALHPGTVESPLSEPFISRGYSNRVLTPQESAAALLNVIGALRPGQTGEFYDWQGKAIPW
tara:strand:+ start:51667 stop:52461 length:795 start_codon:yes stop_codon:yes gene_type:complete